MNDSTIVEFDGVPVAFLNRLDRMDTCLPHPLTITANKGIFGYEATCEDTGDSVLIKKNNAYSITLSSDNELIKETFFSTITQPDTSVHYYASIVTKASSVGQMLLNGTSVSANAFTPFPADSNWVYANLRIPAGAHRLQNDSGFHAFHFSHYPYPDLPTYPVYAHVLPESIVWPPDSFTNHLGLHRDSLQPFSAQPLEICAGTEVFFRPSHLRNIGYLWDFGDGGTLQQNVDNNRASGISYVFEVPGTYWVVLSDTADCHAPDSTLVVVQPSPSGAFDYEVATSCAGKTVQLRYTAAGAQVRWSWPGGSTSGAQASFSTATSDSTIAVTLTATANGCRTVQTSEINLRTAEESLFFPNVITPNGDGINDAWCFNAAAPYASCFEVQIFNRWGQVVYSARNPNSCWEPRQLPEGVYFYTAELGVMQYKGSITVLK